MEKRVWILGASDPEMEAIEALLRDCGESVKYAEVDGRRVHPGNAYQARVPELPPGAIGYAVECIDALPEGWVRIDHHRPGDPGYGRSPEQFLPASSIGQVIAELAQLGRLRDQWARDEGSVKRPRLEPGELYHCSVRSPGANGCSDHNAYLAGDWRREWLVGSGYWSNDISGGDTALYVPRDLILTAAADHCLAAAYAGECLGVDPDELMRWRVESRALFQQRPVEEVLSDVERARKALRSAPLLALGGCPECGGTGGATGVGGDSGYEGPCHQGPIAPVVRDMRTVERVPEIPEASAREGICFIAEGLPDRDTGRRKVVCQSGSPEQIRAFMEVWAPKQGLVDIYGDPARGFAGGYVDDN